MGKRSDFERRKNDAYDTPFEPVKPLLRFLLPGTRFIEPCAGKGHLVNHLVTNGHQCIAAWDTHPRKGYIEKRDAITARTRRKDFKFITNPPWTRELLHPMIVNLSDQAPTWLLFDADWMHTRQATPYLPRCTLVVSVGRVKWIPGSEFTGKDNCCWYKFEKIKGPGPRFIGR